MDDLAAELKTALRENKRLQREIRERDNRISAYKSYAAAKEELTELLKRQKSEQDVFLRLMLDESPDLIVLMNVQRKYILGTDKNLRKFGLDADALREKDFIESLSAVLSEEARDMLLSSAHEAFETGGAVEYEAVTALADGVLFHHTASIITFSDGSGSVIGAMLQVRDVTELQNALAQAQANSAEKSRFLATMSHEIRTPMNGIIGFSELAADDDIPAKTRGYLNNIKLSAIGLLDIINDILDISKIEAGKLSLENIPFDLHGVLEICRAIILPKAEEKGLTLLCYEGRQVPGRLLGDPTRLRQILLNLLSNAVKFTHTGAIKLITEVKSADAGSITIYFEVRDDGIGMTPEHIGKLFQRFTQADDSTTRNYGGTGLGLAIVKSMVELMGGEIRVESAPGLGSRFFFDLTFRTVGDDKKDPQSGAIRFTEKPVFKGEVLICEDNAINREVISDHLSRVGLNYDIALNGKEGVFCVKNRIDKGEPPYGLILMDIHMPVMDGLEAAKRIIQMGAKTPIVALTANIMESDKKMYAETGMAGHLGKPFTAQEIWGCLLKYFTPIRMGIVNEQEELSADEKLYRQLCWNFLEDNRDTFKNLTGALGAGDISIAHRIAHTLKGIAATLGKNNLRRAAYDIESALEHGKNKTDKKQLDMLESELNRAMDDFAQMFKERGQADGGYQKTEKPDDARVLELLGKMEPMLKTGDSDCLDFIDDLRAVPEAEELIGSMERFDFESAYEKFIHIKQKMES